MSMMQCQKCGGMVGVVGITVYRCACAEVGVEASPTAQPPTCPTCGSTDPEQHPFVDLDRSEDVKTCGDRFHRTVAARRDTPAVPADPPTIGRLYELIVGAQIRETRQERDLDLQDARELCEREFHIRSAAVPTEAPTPPTADGGATADARQGRQPILRELLADLKELERIYARDQIAQCLATQIERIFDTWLYEGGEGFQRVHDAQPESSDAARAPQQEKAMHQCRCGFIVDAFSAQRLRETGIHRNAIGKPSGNDGCAYCPACEDETLVEQPAGASAPAPPQPDTVSGKTWREIASERFERILQLSAENATLHRWLAEKLQAIKSVEEGLAAAEARADALQIELNKMRAAKLPNIERIE